MKIHHRDVCTPPFGSEDLGDFQASSRGSQIQVAAINWSCFLAPQKMVLDANSLGFIAGKMSPRNKAELFHGYLKSLTFGPTL